MDRFKTVSLVSIVLLVVLAIVLSVKTIGTRLREPFHLLPKGASGVNLDENEAQKLLALKVQDTDTDSLSDYDELYTYHTSPYLPDTDSDNIPDGEEIKKGTNPNCPEGKDCGSDYIAPSNNTIATSPATLGSKAVDPMTITDPKQIREIIASSGQISIDELNKIDDATLLSTWEEVKKVAGGQTLQSGSIAPVTPMNPVASAVPDPTTSAVATPAELRKLLQDSGMTKEVLDKIDDATLLRVYKETVQKK